MVKSVTGPWARQSALMCWVGAGFCLLVGVASVSLQPPEYGTALFGFGMALALVGLGFAVRSWRVVIDEDELSERFAFVRIRGASVPSISSIRLVEGDVGWIRVPVTDIVVATGAREQRLGSQRRYWLTDRQLSKSQAQAHLIGSLLGVDVIDEVIPWGDPRRLEGAEGD